ncbi:MAG: hypothetical protein IIZ49_02025 [Oscillospiraceae bacterium]|nr:hypothetical protein [Oscillospiraceae bacterium]
MKEILLTSSILILALVLLRAVFRRAIPQRVQYALWGLVLLRLLIPFSIPFGAQSLAAQAKPVLSAVENVGEIPVYTQELGTAPLDAYPGAVAFEPGEGFAPRDVPRTDPTLHPNYAVRSEDGSLLSLYKGIPLAELAKYAWFAGMAGMAVWFLYSNLRFARVLRRTRRLLSGKNRVYVSSAIASPCLFGLFRPAIYVTPEAARDKAKLRHVLIHERTHIRHLDPVWTLLRAVCLIVYFFDPLVWLAAYLSEIDGELACDEGALAVLGEDERSAYGETLLALAALRRVSPPMLTATSLISDKKQMRERITRIAEHRRPIAAALAAVRILAAVVGVVCFLGGQNPSEAVLDYYLSGKNPTYAAMDLRDFEPPQETNTLVVYEKPIAIVAKAIRLFQRKYPDVEIVYWPHVYAPNYEYDIPLSSELAPGEGPDFIWDWAYNLNDFDTIQNMESGVYTDLLPYFAWDESINLKDYNEGAMRFGMYKGHRYMVPLSFETNVWVTTQEILDEAGLKIEGGKQSFTRIMALLRAYKDAHPEQDVLLYDKWVSSFLWRFFPSSGAEIVDLEKGQVTIDTLRFRTIIDAYKDLFYQDDEDLLKNLWPLDYGLGLINRDALFYREGAAFDLLVMYSLLKSTQTPVLVNCPNYDGQVIGEPNLVAYIREGTPNQLNAWRLLKILLSEEIQADVTAFCYDLPVLRSAAKPLLTYLCTTYISRTKLTEYGLLAWADVTWADVTEEEIDAILDVVYEIDDCRLEPAVLMVSSCMRPYFEGKSSYQACLAALTDALTQKLNVLNGG